MMLVAVVVVALVLTCTPAISQDPCHESVYTLKVEDYKRSAGYDKVPGDVQTDRYLDAGWYRFTGPQGEDMVTSSPGFNKCGTTFPIWLSELLGPGPEGSVDYKACAVGFGGDCEHESTVSVKNCSTYNVYYLTPRTGTDQVYCIGTEIPCPAGTFSANGYTPGCQADVDECATNNGGCDQICTNIVGFTGSYTCSCNNGYTLNADGHTCDDIDECAVNNGNCDDICTNIDGSYTCSCDPGYLLNADQHTCDDINECDTNNGNCEDNCINEPGTYRCTCDNGYVINADGHACDDVNECAANNGNCDDTCTNTDGSYTCSCDPGYLLNADKHTCDDIDECAVNNGNCDDACTNTDGSYTCSCDPGYLLNADQHTCDDINECDTNNGNCEDNCINEPGTYRCTCDNGYVINADGHACDDVNECDANNGNCDDTCTNTDGSYTCSCDPGYLLNGDKHTCDDINECDTNNGNCEDNCINEPGTYKCTCDNGYVINADGHTCDDVNECGVNNGNCDDTCTNTDGSYTCSCDPGYLLNGDKHTCDDIDECTNNKGGCDHSCTNTDGSYQCGCNNGYTLNADGHTCDDIDECGVNNGGCDHTCSNNPGSYECTCNPGYNLLSDGHTCQDINECNTGNGGCDHSCTNTDGSYQCGCNNGYALNADGHACDDIDECAVNNGGCDHTCSNNLGSYECTCNPGYNLLSDGHTCQDINECNTDNGGCDHTCTNTDGSYECSCDNGYQLNADVHTCDDVDECATFNGGCSDMCTNTDGSFFCHCPNYYRLLPDNKTCIVEKPAFTGPTITWSIRQDGIFRSVVLECTVEPLVNGLLFEYHWFVGTTPVWQESSQVETSKLLETVWTDIEDIQKDATCEVFARRYVGWEATSANATYFVGFTADKDVLYAEEGGDPVFYVVRPTVPVLCPQGFDDCKLPLEVHTPVSKEDTNIPATCAKDGQSIQQGALEFLQTPCRIDIGMTTVITPNTSFAISISAAVDNVYDGEHVMGLLVAGPERHQYHELMENIVLPEARVYIRDSDVSIAGKVCKARNDPHMTTFDGRNYENQLEGEFILYKHTKFPVEVRAYFRQCNRYATCVCGVAVRSGGDLFVYDSCKIFLKQPQRVRMYECKDDTMNVVAVTRTRYKITLPTGTVVIVERNWIQIVPSITDFKSVEGLCGTLDDDCSNDFRLRDGSFSTAATANNPFCDSRCGIKKRFHPNDFSKSWRVDASDSWYQGKLPDSATFEKVIYCSCPEGGANAVCSNNPRGSASIQNCVEYDENSPRNRCLFRKKRSTSGDDVEEEVGAFDYDPTFQAAFAVWRNGWNETVAEQYCRDDIEGRAALQGDQAAEIADIEGAIDTCVEDIKLSGGTTYTQGHVDDVVEDVTREISKNMSFFSMDASGNVVLPALLSQLCPSDCSNHGTCIDGKCDCYEHYGGSDCSTKLDTIPTLFNIQSGGLCDMQVRPCAATPVQGEYFVPSDSLTCQITPILLENGKEIPQKSVNTKAEYDHTNRLLCPFPNMADGLNDDVTAYTFSVAVANDAKNFSEPKSVTVYDSKCIECTPSPTVQCNIKPNTCYIHQICYNTGEVDPLDECNICDPNSSFNSWSLAKSGDCKGPDNTLMIAGVVSAVVIVCTIAVVVAIIYAVKKTTVTKVTDISISGNGFNKEAYA